MLVAVYSSPKKDETYLYVPKRDDFSAVPKALMETFGTPRFVMLIPLDKREKLAQVDKQKLREALVSPGYYLQLPPPKENLLKAFRAQNSGEQS
ncbi:YcgL domain-containing protein [Aestuariibacter halophilus]|uniref:YcgL domain-containing protein LJ739_08400 n=1 Tax=Fluctibacter halophilus TaxID=226011 RepID=A0ABS8G6W7_9ALTE|nr:YcgL domain-containing protein [Aestuariibacter halophilus]MCC2616258.1 YcgL domain-containing protein [Aestuariibacter halophilus]